MKQKAFTKEYAIELENNIELNLSNYTNEGFNFNEKNVVDMPFEKHEH